MSIVYTPEALEDLEAAIGYLVARNPKAATKLLEQVESTIARLATCDFDGPEVQLISGEWVRSWPIPPLRLYYQRAEVGLTILYLRHHARRPITR